MTEYNEEKDCSSQERKFLDKKREFKGPKEKKEKLIPGNIKKILRNYNTWPAHQVLGQSRSSE